MGFSLENLGSGGPIIAVIAVLSLLSLTLIVFLSTPALAQQKTRKIDNQKSVKTDEVYYLIPIPKDQDEKYKEKKDKGDDKDKSSVRQRL